jgi:hypothetical protein
MFANAEIKETAALKRVTRISRQERENQSFVISGNRPGSYIG